MCVNSLNHRGMFSSIAVLIFRVLVRVLMLYTLHYHTENIMKLTTIAKKLKQENFKVVFHEKFCELTYNNFLYALIIFQGIHFRGRGKIQ